MPDVATTAQDLAANRVRFKNYPGFGQNDLGVWTSPGGSTRIIWFNDPEGKGLSLTKS